MRIAILDPPSFTPPYDHGLASALARRGHEVHLLASPFLRGRAPAPDGYERHDVFFPLTGRLLSGRRGSRLRVALKAAEYLPSAWRLVRRVGALDPDVAHVQWLPMARLDVRWVRALLRERPVVVTAHDVFPRLRRNQGAWAEILGAVDRVVVHTDEAAERLAPLAGSGRLVTIPHPVFEAEPGVEPRRPSGRTLLFFGFVRSYKGLDVLLRALPAVAEEVPDVRLVVAGDPLEPAEPLRALAESLGVGERVEWQLGFVPGERVPALLEGAAAVVLPYRRIDSSGVLAAALGHGRPAVVSDVGSLGEIVRETGAGLVVPPEDPVALAEACVRILTDEALWEEAFRGTAVARESLTWDASALAHERLYEELLGARSPDRAVVAEAV